MISYVRYGSLDVAASARRDFESATVYLSRDPVERALFERLEHGAQRVTLTTNRNDADYYDPDTHAIHWDPHSALRTAEGGRQSPALGLGHEVDHAVHDGPREWHRAQTFDRRFDTAEERRVITGSEEHAARTLGEAVRRDHGGTTYRVDGPTVMPLRMQPACSDSSLLL
jgi:hypothetical protein